MREICHLAVSACCAVEQLIVVERTAQLFAQTNVAILRHVQRLVTAGTMQSHRLGHYQLHVPTTFATPDEHKYSLPSH